MTRDGDLEVFEDTAEEAHGRVALAGPVCEAAAMARSGRNRPCPCGSGKKYKKCCLAPGQASPRGSAPVAAGPKFDGSYFRFRVSLRVDGPAIWRCFLLPGDASFADLHAAVQACGWNDSHLWSFTNAVGDELAGPRRQAPVEPADALFAEMFRSGQAPEAGTVPLARHFREAEDACVYTYDFGDSWQHDICLEGMETHDARFDRALLDGAGVFPPEDCGGAPGWARLVSYFKSGQDPWQDPESLEAWLAADPLEEFDLTAAKRTFGVVLDLASGASMTRITQMDAPLAGTLKSHVEETMRAFVAKVGLDVEVQRASYSDVNARFELVVSTVREDGVVMNKRAEDFLHRCGEFGLREDDLGCELPCGDRVLQVVGLRPRAKLPVLCEQIRPP